MAKSNGMEEFLTSMPFEIRESHRQGLKHRDYVLGYHEYIRQYLQTEIADTRRAIKSSSGVKQSWALMHVLDLIQSLRVYDNFEMICLNMIDFNNDTNASTTVESKPPDTTSHKYQNGWQTAKTIFTSGIQILQVASAFLK